MAEFAFNKISSSQPASLLKVNSVMAILLENFPNLKHRVRLLLIFHLLLQIL